MRAGAVVAADLVGVARAQFTLHLPHQVAKLTARPHPLDEGQIAGVDGAPVDVGHILAPEMVTLEPPRLAVHLLPFAGRHDRHAHAGQIDPAALAAWPAVARRFLGRADYTQAVAVEVKQLLVVARQFEVGYAVGDGLGLVVLEHPGAQFAGLPILVFMVAGMIHRTFQVHAGEQRTARRGADLGVASVLNWEGHHAAFDALQIDLHGSGRLLFARLL